jgi:hypothetical protein
MQVIGDGPEGRSEMHGGWCAQCGDGVPESSLFSRPTLYKNKCAKKG